MVISAHQSLPRHNTKPTNTTRTRQSEASSSSTSASKPAYQKVGKNSLKKIKFHSKSCEDVSKQERVFLKLDPKNPQHAHKIQQRRKAITKGKNTIGYDIYRSSVPKEKRQKRSMITPSTPDHTLDIPNKKWNGLVRSWRVALHRYDPVDLQQSFAAAQEEAAVAERLKASPTGDENTNSMTVKEKEIVSSGLFNLVRVATTNNNANNDRDNNNSNDHGGYCQSLPSGTPRTPSGSIEVLRSTPLATLEDSHGSNQSGVLLSELDRYEAAREGNEDAEFFSGEDDDDDSDDDLL